MTGAGRGIGAAVAQAFGRAGYRVVLASRSVEPARDVADAIRDSGAQALALRCDVTNEADVKLLAADVAEKVGFVDVLVNNAGTAFAAPLAKTSLADWNRILEVNATGTFLVSQAFVPAMVERRAGRVVNVASTAGLHGAPYITAYTAAKHAVVGFTRSLAREVARSGVTVNAVCPGYVDTDLTRESVARIVEKTGRTEAEARASIEATNPQGRIVTPDEVADVVLSLCGDGARAINGETIVMDGGASA